MKWSKVSSLLDKILKDFFYVLAFLGTITLFISNTQKMLPVVILTFVILMWMEQDEIKEEVMKISERVEEDDYGKYEKF